MGSRRPRRHIYIYTVVFENGVLFCDLIVRKCYRLCVQNWGALSPGPEIPIFAVFRGGSPGTSYSRGCAKYRAWSWGIMPKMRLFKAQFCSLYMASSSGLDRVWSRLFFVMCKNAQNCGKNGFFTFQNRRNFAETTENVVPNWWGRKTQFLHPRVRNGLSWSG